MVNAYYFPSFYVFAIIVERLKVSIISKWHFFDDVYSVFHFSVGLFTYKSMPAIGDCLHNQPFLNQISFFD
jgi:hypothetical protein